MSFSRTDQERIDRIAISRIAKHHGDLCCDDAEEWLFARITHSPSLTEQVLAVPSLLRLGATRWPHFWCELAYEKKPIGDCGVHADIASQILKRWGITHTRGRAALEPVALAPPHWRLLWGEASEWIGSEVVHHEVLRVGARWWDPTEARWFAGPGSYLPVGRVVGVREEGGAWTTTVDPPAD